MDELQERLAKKREANNREIRKIRASEAGPRHKADQQRAERLEAEKAGREVLRQKRRAAKQRQK